MLASTPCQRAVGAQQVPWLVDSAYARLFDGITMTTGQENRACEVLLRLHFEQVAADSIAEQALQSARVKVLALETQRNALLRGLITNEADRATLDARTQQVGVGAGALRSRLLNGFGARGGGVTGAGGGGMRGRSGAGSLPVLDSVMLRGGGGRGARGRGGDPADPAMAASAAVRLVDLVSQMTFKLLFDGMTLTPEQEANAKEIIRAAEDEARSVALPARMVRLRLAPVPGVVTLNGASVEELKAILSNDADRATLQTRIIIAPQ